MANAFIKPTVVVDTAIKLLQREIVLPQLVWLNGLGDFAGKYQDTITIRVPARTTANTRSFRGTGSARNLVTSDLTENAIAVTLDSDVYHAAALTDEELTMDITDFAGQVLNRQVRAVAEELENGLSREIIGANYAQNNMRVDIANAAGIFDAIVDARRKLNDKYVDRNGRVLVVGSAIEAAFLKSSVFNRYDSTGDAPNTALRQAVIGDVAGLQVVVSDVLPHGEAFMFHPTAFIMATRAPAAPRGASFTAAASAAGLAARWLMDYDYSSTTDRSLIDTFVGYQAVVDPVDGFVRGVRLHLKASSLAVSGNGVVTAAAGANKTRQLVATDSSGDVVTADPETVWASSVPGKATVSSTGLVTGVAAGTTDITVTKDGVTSPALTVTVS